jgi:ABC-type amino acid transport system permease subunit
MDINNLFQTTASIVSKGLTTSIYLTTGSFFIGLGFRFVIVFFQTVVGGVVSKILDTVVRILRSAPQY